MANVVDSRGRGRGTHGQSTNNGGRNGNGRDRGNKVYTYCDKLGHTIDTCYQKHGYPPHYFKKNDGKVVNNYTQDDEELVDDDDSKSVYLRVQQSLLAVAHSPSHLNKEMFS